MSKYFLHCCCFWANTACGKQQSWRGGRGWLVIPSFDVSPHYGDRACCCTGAMQCNTTQCNALWWQNMLQWCAVQCLPVIEQSAKCSVVQFSSTHPDKFPCFNTLHSKSINVNAPQSSFCPTLCNAQMCAKHKSTKTQTNKTHNYERQTHKHKMCVCGASSVTGRLQWAWKRRLIISWIKPTSLWLKMKEGRGQNWIKTRPLLFTPHFQLRAIGNPKLVSKNKTSFSKFQ